MVLWFADGWEPMRSDLMNRTKCMVSRDSWLVLGWC